MRKLAPIPTYYLIQAVFGLLFTGMATVSTLYRVQVVHLNPLQLVLVGTVLEAAYFLGEIPTGVVADVYSRKLSLIIGYLLVGLGFMVEGLFPTFTAVLLAQVIWGVGATFLSGAESAWLAGEIGEEPLTHVMIRGGQIGRIVSILGILLAMAVGAVNLGLAYTIAGGGIAFLGLTLIALMPETNFEPAAVEERETWRKLARTFSNGFNFVAASRVLLLIFSIELCFGFSSEGIDRLSEAHLIEDFVWPTAVTWQPVIWIGLIRIGNSLVGLAVTEWLRRNLASDAGSRTIQAMQVLSILYTLTIVAFAFAMNFTLGVITYMTLAQTRGGLGAIYGPWVTKQIDRRVRATVLSMWGQMNALGQMIGGPLIGALATAATLPIGYAATALILLPVPFLFGVIRRRQALAHR